MRHVDHNLVGIKRQFKPNSNPPHRHVKTETTQLGVIHTTFGRTWTVKQDIPDRYTDREDVPRYAMMAIYLDATNLVMPGPKNAGGLHRSYS